MTSFLKKTMIAAVLGFAAVASAVPAASAAGLDVSIETVGYRNGFHGHDDRRGDRHWDRGRDRDRHHAGRDRRGRCSPGYAVEKARDFGLRRARIAHVTPRQVVVEGVRFQRHGRIAFANVRGCPVLWR